MSSVPTLDSSLRHQLSQRPTTEEAPAEEQRGGEITVKLTDKWLLKQRWCPGAPVKFNHDGMPGFCAYLSKRNQITFKLRRYVHGVRRTAVFNPFHPIHFNLQAALDEAALTLMAWRKGELEVANIPTLQGLIGLYAAAREKGERIAGTEGLPGSWEKNLPLFRTIYHQILPMPVDKIRSGMLTQCEQDYLDARVREAKKHGKTKKPPKRTVNVIIAGVTKPMLGYAMRKHWFPVQDLAAIKADGSDEGLRFLLPGELQTLFPVFDALPDQAGLFPRFLLAHGCRMGLALKAQWRDLRVERMVHEGKPEDVLVWRVPKERMVKGERAVSLIVGESRRIIEVLRALWIASPDREDDTQPVFPDAIQSKWGGNRDKITKACFEGSGTKGWHRHDLRRTHATYLGYAGAAKGLVALSLNHASATGAKKKDSGKSAFRDVTDRYMRSTTYLELARAQLEMHQLLNDFERGVRSDMVAYVESELVVNADAQTFMEERKIDRQRWVNIQAK